MSMEGIIPTITHVPEQNMMNTKKHYLWMLYRTSQRTAHMPIHAEASAVNPGTAKFLLYNRTNTSRYVP